MLGAQSQDPSVELVLEGQGLQAVEPDKENVPAGQAVQAVALLLVENVPPWQDVQLVAIEPSTKYCPALQHRVVPATEQRLVWFAKHEPLHDSIITLVVVVEL